MLAKGICHLLLQRLNPVQLLTFNTPWGSSGWEWGTLCSRESGGTGLLLLLFSCSVVSDSLWLHGLQHARLSCPSWSPGVCSDSCPLSLWCHPTISSSVTPFSSCLQSFPASGSFPMSWLFTSGSQSVGALAAASVLPMNTQGWFPLGLTGLISLLSKWLLIVSSSTTIRKHQFFGAQPFFILHSSHCLLGGHSCAHNVISWSFYSYYNLKYNYKMDSSLVF